MTVNQIYSLVNTVNKQARGIDAVAVVDVQGLVSLGTELTEDSDLRDNFFKSLVDRIGKTIISVRRYDRGLVPLMMDTFDFGAIMQKVYVSLMSATKNETWDLQDGESYDPFVVTKPTVKQKLFSERSTWEIPFTIVRRQIQSAFTNPQTLAAFIDAIYLAVENSMTSQLLSTSRLAYANFIGEKYYASTQPSTTGVHVINLLADYNTEHNTSLTPTAALRDVEFLKYATSRIKNTLSLMSNMSQLYNLESYDRFTPRDKARVTILDYFAAHTETYLQADTYHDELVKLPYYETVPYWQGTGKTADFADLSAVKITTASGHDVDITGVIGMISDIEAIGMTVYDMRTTTMYNGKTESTNYWSKADVEYFNDLSENGVIFTVQETT